MKFNILISKIEEFFSKSNNGKAVALSVIFSLFVLARFIPHPANFTPVLAVFFCSGLWFLKRSWLLLVPVFFIFLTDLVIGLYPSMTFTYLAYFLIFATGALLATMSFESKKMKALFFLASNVSASVIFFVISNLGVWWMSPMYTQNLQGLIECFVLAVPFYPATLGSQVFYAVIIHSIASYIVLQDSALFKKAS